MALHAFLFLATGVFSVILFHLDFYFPIWFSVFIFSWVTLFLFKGFLDRRIGILMMVLWGVFALPFIHIVPYLWFDFSLPQPIRLWGLAVNPYMVDESVVELTGMIGAVGAVGFGFAISAAEGGGKSRLLIHHGMTNQAVSLPFLVWLIWLVLGVDLSWLAAPQETITGAKYTQSEPLLDASKFASAWMVSYGFLVFAFCDAVFDSNKARRSCKLTLATLAVIFVVVYLQLLRGDRESLPMVLALFIVYFYWGVATERPALNAKIFLIIGSLVFGMLVVSLVLGLMRTNVDGQEMAQIMATFDGFVEAGYFNGSELFYGTWSAVLLSPLSAAGDAIHSFLRLGLGEDYVNFVLSIPPGFIADAIGYARPIDGLHGPAWEMRYGQGGTHATVVPFLNFRIIGVLLVTAVWAYTLHTIEWRVLNKNVTTTNIALLAFTVTVAPHWLWYGEKYFLNAFFVWLILQWLYRIRGGMEKLMQTVSLKHSQQVSIR